jgi:hypothetical protein
MTAMVVPLGVGAVVSAVVAAVVAAVIHAGTAVAVR